MVFEIEDLNYILDDKTIQENIVLMRLLV